MNNATIRSRRWLIGAAAVFALAVLVAVSTVSRSAATEGPSTAETFAVLETGAADPAVLSQEAQAWLGSLDDFGGGTTPPSEVGAATAPTGDAMVVAASEESVCFLNADLGMSNCADPSDVATGQVYTAAPDFEASPDGCAGWKVIGLMPDGVDSLTVDAPGADGPVTIPVTSNVYTATLPPVRTTLSSGDISVEIPLDQFASGNTSC